MKYVEAADEAVREFLSRYDGRDLPPDAETLIAYYLSERRGLETEARRIVRELRRWQ